MFKSVKSYRKLDLQYFGGTSTEEDHESEVKASVVIDAKLDIGRLNLEGIELKASTEEKGVIEGYASTFGNIDRHGDIIEKGAFAKTRKRIPIFGMHNPREGIGTGTVTEDEKGLKIRIKLAIDNADSDILRERAKEYYAMAKEGIIERLSIGFSTLEQEFAKKNVNGRERMVRLIKKVDLMETSLVPIPANDLARIGNVKSFEDLTEEQKAKVDELVSAKTKELQDQIKSLEDKIKGLEQEKAERKSLDSIISSRLNYL
jgi:uncharacterized protein